MNHPAAVFALVKKVLREDVKPELSSDHANTQLAGVLDILEKLERILVPSPEILRQKLAIIDEATHTAPTSLEEGEAALRRLTDQAFENSDAELHAVLLATMKKLLQVERSAVPRADFGAMTGGKDARSK